MDYQAGEAPHTRRSRAFMRAVAPPSLHLDHPRRFANEWADKTVPGGAFYLSSSSPVLVWSYLRLAKLSRARHSKLRSIDRSPLAVPHFWLELKRGVASARRIKRGSRRTNNGGGWKEHDRAAHGAEPRHVPRRHRLRVMEPQPPHQRPDQLPRCGWQRRDVLLPGVRHPGRRGRRGLQARRRPPRPRVAPRQPGHQRRLLARRLGHHSSRLRAGVQGDPHWRPPGVEAEGVGGVHHHPRIHAAPLRGHAPRRPLRRQRWLQGP